MITEHWFDSNGIKLFGVLNRPDDNSTKLGIVFFHGGGKSTTERYKFLQEKFAEIGIASFVFDFRGCGKSEGKFEDGGLKNRIEDGRNAIKTFLSLTSLASEQIYLWGSSMGGHVVCRLLKEFSPKGVILQSAAAYSKEAEKVKLNEEFTTIIRQENNWSQSPAFVELDNFSGRVLVIYGGNDEIIPIGVKEKYKSYADEYFELSGGGHALLNPQNDMERGALDELAKLSISFVNNQIPKHAL